MAKKHFPTASLLAIACLWGGILSGCTTEDAANDANTGITPTETCGDGTKDPGEQCDDGNLDPNDGCDELCAREGAAPGITVTPVEGLDTTEDGGTATFTIELDSEPTEDVTIELSSDNEDEGTVEPDEVTFTADDWDEPQTITVTGVDDDDDDGDQTYAIVTDPATSDDDDYDDLNADDVEVTNADDDGGATATITVTPTTGLITTESGGTATFTITLSTQPTANVVIGLSSADSTEGTFPSSVTFTTADWAAKTVTVTGANDPDSDGAVDYTITTAAAISTDENYGGVAPINPADVTVTNADNEAGGVTVTAGASLSILEGEVTDPDTVTVVLDRRPSRNVTVALTVSDTTEATLDPATLTFTPTNWNAPQSVEIAATDDVGADGNVDVTLTATTDSADAANDNLVDTASFRVVDADSPGITVSPISGVVTTEGGGSDTFTVRLNSQPTDDVEIDLVSSNTAEGTIFSSPTLTFTTVNWNAPQTVTIRGVNDALADGNRTYTISTEPAASNDPGYSGLDGPNVTVSNTDNDTAGITINQLGGVTTTESGGTDTFTIVLNSEPTDNVEVQLSSSAPDEGTLSANTVTFTPSNWNAPVVITVTGANDDLDDGNQPYTIDIDDVVSDDGDYAALTVASVPVTNTDNDSVGVTVRPLSGIFTTEQGGETTFAVVLNSEPLGNVTVTATTQDETEGVIYVTGSAAPSGAVLTFTTANWDDEQIVTVHGVDDDLADGNQTYGIALAAASAADTAYNALGTSVPDVSLSNHDNDTAGLVLQETTLTTTEAGGTLTFTVALRSQPTTPVTIRLTSSAPDEGTVSPASWVFTPSGPAASGTSAWSSALTVTVTGVDDHVADGGQPFHIDVIADAGSGVDAAYGGMGVSTSTFTNNDNDTAGVQVTPSTGISVEEGSTTTFTVRLTSQPTDDVVIPLTVSGTTPQGTLSDATLTFTSEDWDDPQTVELTGVDDDVADGNQLYDVVLGSPTSDDDAYDALLESRISARTTDDDSAGVVVIPASGLVTTEAGGTDVFSVVLSSEPRAGATVTVTIAVLAGDQGEGRVSAGGAPATTVSLTFNASNWDEAQDVTVTGQDDALDDGDQTYTIQTSASVTAGTDAAYDGRTVDDVSVTNLDND